MTKKPVSKIIALITAAFTLVVMCGLPAVAFAWDGGITKEETVYVVTDSSGTQEDVIVSDHLVNKNKADTISDETTLSDIENVKGEETFKQKGDALTWDAEGNSIYYQGKTDAEVPVTMDIVYRLNDKVVSGSELQGQSGKVEIQINYENNAEYKGTTVPFIVMTGLIVTDDSFKNIKISKGKVIDDGEKLLVVGMAAPGLAQTLGVGESELGFGSTVTITGDADKFAVEDMMTIVTNAFFEDIDSGSIDDLDYDDEIKQLDKGAKALVDGSKLLCDGLEKLNESAPKLEEGVSQLDQGANNLKNGLPNLLEGAKKAKEGSSDVYNGLLGVQELLSVKGYGDGNYSTSKKLELASQIASGVDTALNIDLKKGIAGAITLNNNAVYAVNSANDSLSEVNYSSGDLGTAESEIAAASSAANTIENALTDEQKAELADELDSLDKLGDAKNKVSSAKDAMSSNETKVSNAKDSITTASTLLGTGTESDPGLTTVLNSVSSGINSAAGNMDSAVALINGAKQEIDGIITNLGNKDAEGTILYGAYAVSTGLGNIENGVGTVKGGAEILAAGLDELNNKSGDLVSGVDKLSAGSVKVSNGMAKLYKQGIRKIVDMYNDELKGTLDSARSMLDAGKGYKTFTKLPSGMDGNVKFIYKTDMTE